ncbi:hypothetical protein SU67_25015, partial [Escherichia coli O139:H28 str. E24377A]
NGKPMTIQNSRAVNTSARVTIACDQAPIAPMAIRRNQRRHAHSDPGNLPGDESENDNRHRCGHTQQQLLETVEDISTGTTHALEDGTEMGNNQDDPSSDQ